MLERALGALRRLQSPAIGAFHAPQGIVVSEEFGAVPCGVQPARPESARAFVGSFVHRTPSAMLSFALANFGQRALSIAQRSGLRIIVVPKEKPFTKCSPMVASLVPDIDRWHAPPAGLFVLEERLILLRSGALRMSAAHEFAHALDAALATKPRSYFSFENPEVRACFAHANAFVNEYAASGLDEYFAESMRAYVEVNDDRSSWLPLTRKDLATKDPRMFTLIDNLFRTGRL